MTCFSLGGAVPGNCVDISQTYPNKTLSTLPQVYRKEHLAWTNAKQRCRNPKNPNYPRYGGRGITFSTAFDSFTDFIVYMGKCPKGFTLERKDNSKGYEPGNCIWATAQANCLNRDITVKVIHNGNEKPLATALQEIGLSEVRESVERRLKNGFSFDSIATHFLKGDFKYGRQAVKRIQSEQLNKIAVEYYSLPRDTKGHVIGGWLRAMASYYRLKTFTLIRRAERHMELHPELKNKIPCDVSQYGSSNLPHIKTRFQIDKDKLIARMGKTNKTVDELAYLAGCTAPTIYNIKKGKSCNRQTAKRVAAALKCTLEDLLPSA